MSYDVIDRLVRPANPVPDPRMLAPVDISVPHVRRREEMDTRVDIAQVEETKGRGPWVGIAAAVVVVIGAVALFLMTDDSDVAAPATPVETATTYLEHYAAFDVEGVESMLTEEATVLPWEAFEPSRDWRADLKYLEAAGFQLMVDKCVELPAISIGARVNCQYQVHGLGSDQIGEGPFSGSVFRLVIADGLVRSSDMGFDFSEFSGTMWYALQDWVKENHPDDFDTMYVNEGLSRQTDDAIALWRQRVADYVEYVNNPPAPVEGAAPAELAGTWRGRSETGEIVTVGFDGTSISVNIPGLTGFVLDAVISDDSIVIPATPDSGMASTPGSQCAIDRQYTWSVEGEQLTLTEVVDDTCLTRGYLAGVDFTKLPSS